MCLVSKLGGQTYLLVLLGELGPPLVDLDLDGILLHGRTRGEGGLKICLDNGPRILMVQKGGGEGLLGRIGVLFLLLALALLALVHLGRLVDGSDGLLDLLGSRAASFHDRRSDCGDIVEGWDFALFVAQHRGAVFAVVAQEVSDAVLDVDKAGLQVVEGGNDLVVTVSN